MRWKAIFFENEPIADTFGLKTSNTPKQVPELIEFEKELIGIVPKLKFRKGMNNFQQKMRQDIKAINESHNLLVPADKSSNMYKMEKADYVNLLNNSITSTYNVVSLRLRTIRTIS